MKPTRTAIIAVMCLISLVSTDEMALGNTTLGSGAATELNYDQFLHALEMHHDHIEKHVQDFTCRIFRRYRKDGQLQSRQILDVKLRNEQAINGNEVQPLNVYLKVLRPRGSAGQEVLYAQGNYNDKVLFNNKTLTLTFSPDSSLVREVSNLAITEMGFAKVLQRTIDKLKDEESYRKCSFLRYQSKIDGRPCTTYQVTHPRHSNHGDLHIGRLFIDDKLGVPTRYAMYAWPTEHDPMQLIEECTFSTVRLNTDLVDADFDPLNGQYGFSSHVVQRELERQLSQSTADWR